MRTITLSVPEDFNDSQLMELLRSLGISTMEEQPTAAADTAIERGRILDRLVAAKAFSDISDPVAWQREQRTDRKLL